MQLQYLCPSFTLYKIKFEKQKHGIMQLWSYPFDRSFVRLFVLFGRSVSSASHLSICQFVRLRLLIRL